MGWSIGYDSTWERDIGYGVPATCDHPGCTAKIDRGLGYVCGGEPYGGEHGCGLFICSEHTHGNRHHHQLCQHCADRRRRKLQPSPDHPEWVRHKLTDPSWQDWRDANPAEADALEAALVSALREAAVEDLFADTTFGKLALQKLAPVEPNFRLFSAGWLGDNNERDVMDVTGAEFRAAKRGPRKGQLCILVKGSQRTAYITAAEIKAMEKP